MSAEGNLPVPIKPNNQGKHSAENGRKGGRPPKGDRQVRQRLALHARIQTGKAPLDTMLNNMDYWVEKADELTERTEEVLDALTEAPVEQQIELLQELNKSMKGMMAARENAQKCAVEAAPYCHPRLASITMEQPQPQPKVAAAKAGLTAKEAAAQYEQRLRSAVRV